MGEQGNYRKAYTITDDNNTEVGDVEGYLNDYGELVSVVKIYGEENQKKGLALKLSVKFLTN